MAIRTYTDEKNKKRYAVSVNARSKINPHIRKQKSKKGIETRTEAERLERKLFKECLELVAKIDGEGYYWGQICEMWKQYKLNDDFEPVSPQTLEDNYRCLKKYTFEHWDRPAKQFNRGDIKRIIKQIEKSGFSKKLQGRLKSSINQVFNWAMEERVLKGVNISPAYGISIKKTSERIPTILNKEEIYKLLNVARETNCKWYPIWAMAVLTGCRSGELYALAWKDIDFSKNIISVNKSYNNKLKQVKSTKAGYWRNVPMNEELKKLLLSLKKTSKTEHILPRLREWRHGYQAKSLKAFCMGIGITPIRFHDLRACFATQLLLNKVAPITVMKIAGWKDLDTMQRYVRLSGIDEQGATDSLKFLPDNEAIKNVIPLFQA